MFLRMTSSAIAVIALTAPAFADVTPAEVWQNWVDYYKANGYAVTEGSRDETAGNLTLKDVTFAYAAPADEGRVGFKVPEIALATTGDGKVRTTMSDNLTGTGSFKDDEDKPVDVAFSAAIPGNEIVSSGTAQDITHEGRLPEATITLDSVRTADKTTDKPVTVKVVNLTYQQRNVAGDLMKIDSTMNADRVEFAGQADDTSGDTPGKASFSGAIEGVEGRGNLTLPQGVDMSRDLNAGLKAGLAVTGTMSAKKMDLGFDFAGKDSEGKDETGKGSLSAEGFTVNAALSTAGLSYQGGSDAFKAELATSDLPMPVSYGTQGSSFDVQIPVMKSDTPAPFKFAYSIGGLTLGDAIWDMFDSGKTLPRDPANLDIDITGLVRVGMDLFDPANMDAVEDGADDAAESGTEAGAAPPAADAADAADPDAAAGGAAQPDAPGTADAEPATDGADDAAAAEADDPMPWMPTEIAINKLALNAVGVRLDASGALSVPEGGTMDAPVGKLNARLDGVNGLIDKLVALGFVSQDEVAGYRMMLAMFAKPAPEGGDALVSEIEFKDGGQVFANGQQVK